jgi:SAM-dependent methyltransferase
MTDKPSGPPAGGGDEIVEDDVAPLMEAIYGGEIVPVDEIPWNHAEPPPPLTELVDSGRVRPCQAIDLGCGAGNYAAYFASRGFTMTGVDISARAIALARETARRHGVSCRFAVADLLGELDLEVIGGDYEFAFDWELLHHIYPRQRARYVANVSRLLRPGALYFSACFSEEDAQFGGRGKCRSTRLGTHLYFSGEEELRSLFSPHFAILELKTVEVVSGGLPHRLACALLKRGDGAR